MFRIQRIIDQQLIIMPFRHPAKRFIPPESRSPTNRFENNAVATNIQAYFLTSTIIKQLYRRVKAKCRPL